MTRVWNGLVSVAVAVILTACAGRSRVAAPVEGHRAEPVAPVMTPVASAGLTRTRAVLQQLADSAVSAPMWRNARWGVLMVDVESGDTLYTHDADHLFMPASNQKLLTGAVALQTLGPGYQWRTPIMLRGTQAGSVFRGDLVVVGSGDPTVSDSLRNGNAFAAFDPVVNALRARGITRITGDIVTAGDAFPGITSGYGWELDDLDEPYGAPVDELLFNEGLLTVMVYGGGQPGTATTLMRRPTLGYPAVTNEVTTRSASESGARVQAVYDTAAMALRLTGTVVMGDSVRVSASYRHPNDAYRAALHERLEASGVQVGGASRTTAASRNAAAASTGARMDTLVTLVSLPLRQVLPRMQKPSQNQVAELLFRTSGLVVSGNGSADSARAVAARTLGLWGISGEDMAYRDGSGMSRHDYVTPRAIVRVLDAMHRSPWAALYRESLPLAGVDGTIANRMKGTPAAGNANAKTGTVDKARSLSGYVTTADGRVVLFSMLCNNFTVSNREVERVQDLLVATLAGMRISDGSMRAR